MERAVYHAGSAVGPIAAGSAMAHGPRRPPWWPRTD